MSEVIFSYQGNKTSIQCDANEKMKDICIRFSNKLNIDINKILFMFNGDTLKVEKKFMELIKPNENQIIILVNEINVDIKKETIISSKEIICPICKEDTPINFHDYKINLICKNNHNINNIFIKDFKNTQKIDISKIICEICKITNKSETNKNEFYKCLKCGLIYVHYASLVMNKVII